MTDYSDVTYRVERFDGEATGTQTYPVPVRPGMTVLDGLLFIQKELDATLGWRYSCRMGICGSCALVINGTPGLACNTQILEVSSSEIHLSPLANFPVIRDLAVDTTSMFEKHRALKPYLVPDEHTALPAGDEEYSQSAEELLDFSQFADCIKCGACMSACPTVAVDDRFPGPMPLTALHRYNADTRDQGFDDRRQALSEFHDPGHCHYAAECSRVCPKGVDPARAIQLLKRSLIADVLHLKAKRKPAERLPPGEARLVDGVGPAPAATVVPGSDES